MKDMNTLQDRIRGSLIGGAIGDALGYPVEFIYSFGGIQARYGERGITRLDTKQFWLDDDEQSGKAVISDDTQMTLFTANGILNAKRQKIGMKYGICLAYIEWYLIQVGKKSGKYNDCWIARIPELNKRRAPGNTCLSSLFSIYKGHDPINNSKGNGGVMRIAPIPLYGVVDNRMSITDATRLAGDAAEITHQHPLGIIPAALDAHIIYRLALDATPTSDSLVGYIHEGMSAIEELYSKNPADVKYMGELCDKAIALANNNKPDLENIESIGGGWVGEEALAIALYCAVRHFDNFEHALIAAVNHAGDSDSTGAISGNILGAAIGYDAIPQFFKEDLELHDHILHMADDLYYGEVTKFLL
jgi:ADP-ribosylglycohydrolase